MPTTPMAFSGAPAAVPEQEATGQPAPGATVRRAAREVVPVALSIAPFGLVIGAVATRGGLPALPHALAAITTFGGAAHLAVLSLGAAGAGLAAAVGIATLINARLLLYSAALEPRFRGQPSWFRWVAPAFIIDQTYVMVLDRDDLADPAAFRRYWLTAGGLLAAGWAGAIGVGAAVGPMLPVGSPLDAAAVVVLAGLLGPRLAAPRPAAVAATALTVSVLGAPLPGGVGLAAGIGAGTAVGLLMDRRDGTDTAGTDTAGGTDRRDGTDTASGGAPAGRATRGARPAGPDPDDAPPDGPLPDDALPDDALPDGPLPDGPFPDGPLPDDALPDDAPPDGPLPDGPLPDDAPGPASGDHRTPPGGGPGAAEPDACRPSLCCGGPR
ncbi:MAG: AzlC family ABC transporter permease [Pseudonocardia sp.]